MNTNAFIPLAQAFGLTVAHSLWQITLIWLVFKLLEWKLGQRQQTMYLLSLGAMLGATLWSVITFASIWAGLRVVETEQVLPQEWESLEPSALVLAAEPVQLSLWQNAQFWLENHAAQIGGAWLVCAGLLWLRLLGGWWLAQRLRRREVSQASESFQNLCNQWAKRLNINTKIQLLESPFISEPLTMGCWKPVVLFPVGMLLQLSPAQVEVLLLHELAHIRRYDYWVNLVQLALEVCFFYHPLFWMLSREARSRREFCCDEVVLRHTANPLLYAKTLTDLQLSSLQPLTPFVMNATGKSRFTERIMHIVGISPKRSARPNFMIAMMLPLALGLSSWWPAPHESTENLNPESITTDSVAPRKTAVDPSIARPKESTSLAPKKTAAPDAGKKTDSPTVEGQLAPGASENIAFEVVKMNVFYIGVDNPLRIAAAGIPANELKVELIGEGTITGGNGDYIVNVRKPGEVKVRVSRVVGNESKMVVDQWYRVKRIPDATPKLDGKYSTRAMSPEEMQATEGIQAILENFDFDAFCEVVAYQATYLPKEANPISMDNVGGAWNARLKEMVKSAKPGDTFFFDDIKLKCPGDAAARNVGGLAFKIK